MQEIKDLRTALASARKDVAKARRAERALKESEEKYRFLFEAGTDAFMLIDIKTLRIVDANNAACRLYGYGKDELLGMKVIALSAEPKKSTTAIRNVIAENASHFSLRYHKRKDGTVFPVEISAGTFTFKERDLIFSIFRDITERKQSEQALQDSEHKFRGLADQSPNMIFINIDGQIVYVNKKCEEMMEYSRDELCSPDFDFLTLMAPKHQQQTMNNFKKHMNGKNVPSFEYTLLTKTGKKIETVITTELIKYDGERAILGIVTDISALKQAEVKLKETAHRLRIQKKALREKNIAMNEILAQIEADRLQMRRQVTVNTEKLLLPLLARLKRKSTSPGHRDLEMLERNLKNLTSQFGINISQGVSGLSARQIEICDMIRSGSTSKEIADLMHVSVRTVDTQRNRIRKKLGISGKDVNLFAHLQTLDTPTS